MKVRDPQKVTNKGAIALTYSETGVGKTVSAIQSGPTPMLLMCAEFRDIERSVEASERELVLGDLSDPKDYVIAEYTSWHDNPKTGEQGLVRFLNQNESIFEPFNFILLDGLTQLVRNLAFEIEDAAYDALPDDKKRKELILGAKLSQEGYGALAERMSRIMPALGRLSQQGKYVIINMLLEQEENKWEGTYKAYPSLMGQKFGRELPGTLDLIGMATKRFDKSGKVIYPPVIHYEPYDAKIRFECKWTGKKIKAFENGVEIPDPPMVNIPLDYRTIFGLNR